ncbi:MAG TPA: Zn-dependent hydrolase [Dehalococcoidia bacterium]|nr:Zn-dependent hydrolase [Dehalococcoidia bacterium]
MDFSIDPAVVERCVEELSTPGRLPTGGMFRAVYTPEWLAAQQIVAGWCDKAGLTVRRDAVGNLFGRLEGRESGAAFVTGSHVDTVRNGGKYDGALGVIAGYLAVRTLKERFGPPRRPIEVMVTAEEEGSRYQANYWGTRAVTGQIEPREVESLRDAAGLPIGEAMRSVGLDPAGILGCRRRDIAGFFELHVEQGKILETEGVEIGIVETITGIRRFDAVVEGQPDHAGTTPMDLRRDAAQAAAEMTLAVAEVAIGLGRPAVATVGQIEVHPSAYNIVPGLVRFGVDARHPDPEAKQTLIAEIERRCREIASRRDVTVRFDHLKDSDPAPMSAEVMETIASAATALGYTHRRMTSGAGHDASIMSSRYPAGMIFVPSRDGRSHSPAEYTPPDQAAKGIAVLAAALHRLAY